MNTDTSKGRRVAIESYHARIRRADSGLKLAAMYGVIDGKPIDPYVNNNVPRCTRTREAAEAQLAKRNYWAEQIDELSAAIGISTDVQKRDFAFYITNKRQIPRSRNRKGPRTALKVKLS